MVVVFDFGAARDFEAGLQEDRLDPRHGGTDGWGFPQAAAPGQGDIDAVGLERSFQRGRRELFAAHFERARDALLGRVDGLAGRRALGRRQAAQALQQFGQPPFLAEIVHPDLVQRGQIGGVGDGVLRGVDESLRVSHVVPSSEKPGAMRRQARACPRGERRLAAASAGECGLGTFRESAEGGGVVHCEVRQDFTIDLDTGPQQAIHEP